MLYVVKSNGYKNVRFIKMLHGPFSQRQKFSRLVKLAASLAHKWNTKIFTSEEPFWPTALLSRPQHVNYTNLRLHTELAIPQLCQKVLPTSS